MANPTLYAFKTNGKILLIALNAHITTASTATISAKSNNKETVTIDFPSYNSKYNVSTATIAIKDKYFNDTNDETTEVKDLIIRLSLGLGVGLTATIVDLTELVTGANQGECKVTGKAVSGSQINTNVIINGSSDTKDTDITDKYTPICSFAYPNSSISDFSSFEATQYLPASYRDSTISTYGLTKQTTYYVYTIAYKIITIDNKETISYYVIEVKDIKTGDYSELQPDYQKQKLYVLNDTDLNPIDGNSTNKTYWENYVNSEKLSAQNKYGTLSTSFPLEARKRIICALFQIDSDREIKDNQDLMDVIKTALEPETLDNPYYDEKTNDTEDEAHTTEKYTNPNYQPKTITKQQAETTQEIPNPNYAKITAVQLISDDVVANLTNHTPYFSISANITYK